MTRILADGNSTPRRPGTDLTPEKPEKPGLAQESLHPAHPAAELAGYPAQRAC